MNDTLSIVQVIKTKDGSNTLLHHQYNEIYHSRNGAYSEAMHVFVNAGLTHQLQSFNTVNILEIGFGSGLNCILSLAHNTKKIHYTGVDVLPIEWNTIAELGYPTLEKIEAVEADYKRIINADWNSKFIVNDDFTLTKLSNCLLSMELPQQYNLVYFDAFAPNVQPNMWKIDVFDKIYQSLETGAVLVTYCAKGQVKRDLMEVGFTIEKLEGPPGKREMIRATKKA